MTPDKPAKYGHTLTLGSTCRHCGRKVTTQDEMVRHRCGDPK